MTSDQWSQLHDCFPILPNQSLCDTLFLPFVESKEAFLPWLDEVDQISLNHPYGPYSVLWYVIREYPRAFDEHLNKETLYDQEDVQEVCQQFNSMWNRIQKGDGNGAKYGMCNEDELIMTAVLFVQVLAVTEPSYDIDWQGGVYESDWTGEPEAFMLSRYQLQDWSYKMRGSVYMSALPWTSYVSTYQQFEDDQSLWCWVPPLWGDIDETEVGAMIDRMMMQPKAGRELMALDLNHSLKSLSQWGDHLEYRFGFEPQTVSVTLSNRVNELVSYWENDQAGLCMYPHQVDDMIIIANYHPKQSRLYRRV